MQTIEVNKLLKGKPMDNLEFLQVHVLLPIQNALLTPFQWLKRYHDLNSSGAAYNAAQRRGGLGDKENEAKVKPAVAPSVPKTARPKS